MCDLPQVHVEKLCTLDRDVHPTPEWTLHFHIYREIDGNQHSFLLRCVVVVYKQINKYRDGSFVGRRQRWWKEFEKKKRGRTEPDLFSKRRISITPGRYEAERRYVVEMMTYRQKGKKRTGKRKPRHWNVDIRKTETKADCKTKQKHSPRTGRQRGDLKKEREREKETRLPITIIRSTPDRDDGLIKHEFITLHGKLMSPRY